MRLRAILPSLLFGASMAGCADLDLTNPNQTSTATAWRTEGDAQRGINAVYSGLMPNGAFGRWVAFVYDIRSDEGFSPSPWAELSQFNKFTLGDYNFEINREVWIHHFQAIFRANQVVTNVPNIEMDPTQRDQIVGQAKFLRALLYYNLVNLYGNVTLTTEPPEIAERPATVAPEVTWAQIESDLTDAEATLPLNWTGGDIGRATSGAAAALLGKSLLQQHKWDAAAAAFQTVVSSNQYSLITDYAENFTDKNENNSESVFEVQFGGPSLLASGVRGLNIAKMNGPCGPTFCDGRPTRWFFDQFFLEPTVGGGVDPRLDATIFWNKPGGEDVYGQSFLDRYADTPDALFFKKYGEYYIHADQDWDAAINYRVIRYADVLLGLAEALNESGHTGDAYQYIDQVRARANLAPLPAGLSAAAMRDRILHERLLEFGLEGQRWNDLKRYDLLDDVKPVDAGDPLCTPEPYVAGCDAEFSFFVPNKSELLPIPTQELNTNPNATQNPGW